MRKTYYALMHYGIDCADCYGIVDSEELAEKWQDSDPIGEHMAVKFTLNEIEWPSWCKSCPLCLVKPGKST